MDRALERLVWQRADSKCEYCRMPQAFDPLPFQIDHIIAGKHLGKAIASNLALACAACNRYKGPNIAGLSGRKISRLFHPRRHKWERHFRWEGGTLVGQTAIGRVTVQVLEINAGFRVAQRQALMEEGVFPS